MGGGIAIGAANHSKPTLLLTGCGDFILSSINMVFSSLKGEIFEANFEGYEHMFGPTRTVNFKAASAAWFRCQLTNDGDACRQITENSPIFSGARVDMKTN